MKARIIEVEGTEDEVSKVVDRFFAGKPAVPAGDSAHGAASRDDGEPTAEQVTAPVTGSGPHLPPEVRDLVHKQAPGRMGELVESFILEAMGWGDVWARRGKSVQTSDGFTDYVGLHRRGSHYGAFVYVRPASARVLLRLPSDAADGLKHAEARDVKERDVYKVVVYLTSEDAKVEALALARRAYEHVLAVA